MITGTEASALGSTEDARKTDHIKELEEEISKRPSHQAVADRIEHQHEKAEAHLAKTRKVTEKREQEKGERQAKIDTLKADEKKIKAESDFKTEKTMAALAKT